MKTEKPEFLPEARRDGIITKEVEGELLVYDRTRDKAHCLNETAAAIWKRCDGRTTANEIAGALARESGAAVREQLVWLGLEELGRKHLLERGTGSQSMVGAPRRASMSRREAIKRVGLGAAIALPIVVSITSPMPAQAGTCKHGGSNCTTGADCCSGVCQPQPPGSPKCLGG